MALYTDTVMDHFMHPRNVGEIADADGVGQVGNAKCGDIMKMYPAGRRHRCAPTPPYSAACAAWP